MFLSLQDLLVVKLYCIYSLILLTGRNIFGLYQFQNITIYLVGCDFRKAFTLEIISNVPKIITVDI